CTFAESMAWGARRGALFDKIPRYLCTFDICSAGSSPFFAPELLVENLALQQQLLTLDAPRPRPRLSCLDGLLWIVLRRAWSPWRRSLILVTPETVVRWHRTGSRLYWR